MTTSDYVTLALLVAGLAYSTVSLRINVSKYQKGKVPARFLVVDAVSVLFFLIICTALPIIKA